MKKLCTVIFAATLSACSNAPVEGLPENMTLSAPGSMGEQYIKAVSFDRAGQLEKSIPTCVALNIDNNPVTLSDDSASFVGQYTGNAYNIERHQTVGGGKTIADKDSRSGAVVATGTTEYMAGAMVPLAHAVRFKALVSPIENGTVIQFQNIETAQKDTGYAENRGFSRAGTWKTASPMKLYNALKTEADSVFDCLYGQ